MCECTPNIRSPYCDKCKPIELLKNPYKCDDYVMDCEVENSKPNKADIHMEICYELNSIYKRKNADYNDSFAKARKEVPNYTLGKLYDKFERYKQLSKQDRQVEDETIIDTLIDMGNYVIMELVERRLEAKK